MDTRNGAHGSMVVKTSADTAGPVLARLREGIRSRGIHEFAVIDHAAGARAVGVDLPFETVVIFGNAEVGTPLMLADARTGLDLPLRVLVRALPAGGSEVLYYDPRSLAESFDLAPQTAALDRLSHLLDSLTDHALAGSTVRGSDGQ
ncbi:DUF302 domain-containing protein [Microbacterium sp. P04]|uniref:DUF302 domain-containing protein n=1 Tax=Microbacterium sp. P04 TaxID=3366947 RepID=UPI003744F42B